jgi:hypothetical protein
MNPSDPRAPDTRPPGKPESSPGMKVLKVVLILAGIAVALPVVGALLVFGYCALNGVR